MTDDIQTRDELLAEIVRLRAQVNDLETRLDAVRQPGADAQQYRQLFEEALHPITVCDQDATILLVNPAGAHYLGQTVEDCLGRSLNDFIPEIRQLTQQRFEQVLTTGFPLLVEDEVTLPAGRQCFLSMLQPFRTDDGPPRAIQIVSYDITEHKHAQEALAHSEERYRALIENLPLGIATHLEGKLLFANQAAADILGAAAPADLVGTSIWDFIPVHRQPWHRERMRQLYEERQPTTINQAELVRLDGSMVTVELHGIPIMFDGHFAAQTVFRDITHRKRAEHALRTSEARFRHLYASVQAGVIVQAADGTITHVNDVACAIFDMSPVDIVETDSFDPHWNMILEDGTPVSGEDHPSMITMRTGQPVRNAVRGMFADDQCRWLLINTEPIRDAATGSLQEVIVTFNDITAQKETERQLRDERDFSERLIQTAQVIVLVLDMQGRIVRFNPYMEALSGYRLAEVQGQDWFSTFLSPRERDQLRALFGQVAGSDRPNGTINPILTRDGEERLIEWYSTTLKDGEGAAAGVLSIGLDVTERQRAEAAEREQRQLATALVTTAEIVNSTLDFDDVMQRILDVLADVVPHDGANLMLIDEDRAEVYVARYCDCYARRGLDNPKTGVSWPLVRLPHLQRMIEHRTALAIPDTAANEGWVSSLATFPIRSYVSAPIVIEDQVIGFLNVDSITPGFYDDHHAVHLRGFANQAAIAIQNAQMFERLSSYSEDLEREVLARTAALTEANLELTRLSRIKDEFVSNVSHELKSPITSLMLRHHLLRKSPDRMDNHLGVLERETARLGRTIEDLLRLSRLDQGTVEVVFAPVDLNDIVANLVNDRAMSARQQGLAITFREQDDLPPVMADQGLLEQVLSILLTNAINYTPPGGDIMVSTQTTPPDAPAWAGFSVADTGLGIPPDEQPHLFERFFQGKANRQVKVSGTGLGLAIAQEIIERHEGRIEVESAGIPGEGTTFNVWLPVIGENHG